MEEQCNFEVTAGAVDKLWVLVGNVNCVAENGTNGNLLPRPVVWCAQ